MIVSILWRAPKRGPEEVCPNCHARVTHGKDGPSYNLQIKNRIAEIEANLTKISSEE
jgi:hypothetical protein